MSQIARRSTYSRNPPPPAGKPELDVELRNQLAADRRCYRKSTLRDVVRAALQYDRETRMEGPIRIARMAKAEQSLWRMIEFAHEARQFKEPTELDIMFARETIEARKAGKPVPEDDDCD